jgi:uncharacterized membrane protein (DUF4010 family)
MSELFAHPAPVVGFVVAALIGFLVGRTREDAAHVPRPGIRDFTIIALIGAIVAQVGEIALSAAGLLGAAAMLVVARLQHPERVGMTTELAALATFLIGYLCLTAALPLGAALGIVLAVTLAAKSPLHHFALETISEREFTDTLRFLALIFVVFPVLPAGSYGPFDFLEPRKIWVFVVLVSAVSFVGYFLTKFLDPGKGMLLTAVFGGLASTTAFTAGTARAVADSPDAAVRFARAALVANTIMAPRMLVIVALIAPALALAALPALGAMTLAAALAAWALGHGAGADTTREAAGGFKNPFSLGPALRLGAVFTAVLFLIHAGKHYLGDAGVLVSSTIGGLVDVDAVTLSVCPSSSTAPRPRRPTRWRHSRSRRRPTPSSRPGSRSRAVGPPSRCG